MISASAFRELTLVADNVVDVVFTTDATYAARFVSPSVERVLGMSSTEARGHTILEAVHPEDRPRLERLFVETVPSRPTGQIEIRLRHHKTGAYLWFEAIGRAIYDAHGQPEAHVVVLRDIDARKRAEAALLESEARNREVIGAATEVIFQTDLRGRWKLLSPSWTALTGHSVAESLDRSAHEFLHPDDREAIEGVTRRVLRSGDSATEHRARILTKSGRTRWIEVSVAPSRNAASLVTGATGTIRDVTARHQRDALDGVARALDRQILQGTRLEVLLQDACAGLASSMKYPLVWIARAQKDGSAPFVARAGVARGAIDGYSIRWDDSPAGAGPNGLAMRTRRTQTVTLDDPRSEWTAKVAAAGFAWLTAIPLLTPSEALGVLCICGDRNDSFDEEHVSALESFAARLSLALQLADHHELLALQGAAMAAASNALFITDATGRIDWVNSAFEVMSGYSREEAVGRTPTILRCEQQAIETFQTMWATVRAGKVWRGEIVNRRKSGEIYVVFQIVRPLTDADGKITHLVASHEDVTARRQAEIRIEHMAQHDPLTDLPNRAVFGERLQVAIAKAEHDGERVGVLFLDLDRFKLVNDTLGHLVGDGLLREIANRLRQCIRAGDVVARFGGDEFTIILQACDECIATRVAERVVESLRQTACIAGHDLTITGSIGIALSSSETRDADALIKQADAAMYQAKGVGRNGYAFFSEGLEPRSVAGLTIQSGLRRALANGELMLEYQPQVSASGKDLMGVEALLRWTSPELGKVSPADFIPVAELTGVIVDIDRWVLKTACAQARAWQRLGLELPSVAVNISGLSFHRGQLLKWIEEALASTGLAPECLEIELTEGIMMHDATKVIETLASLRRLGVRVALDDFGTGYSSLSYLKRFKLDVLKIDRSFVTSLPDDPDSAAIARLIVAMAKALRIKTVAEGVETPGQATFLEGIGCDMLQGFLFSRSLAPAALVDFARLREASEPSRPPTLLRALV